MVLITNYYNIMCCTNTNFCSDLLSFVHMMENLGMHVMCN